MFYSREEELLLAMKANLEKKNGNSDAKHEESGESDYGKYSKGIRVNERANRLKRTRVVC